jgi:MFS family permease
MARDPRPSLRQRATRVIFLAVALGSTGIYGAVVVGPLVATDVTGSAASGGTPVGVGLIGTAAGSALLSMVMSRRGRRAGLRLGYALGVLGSGAAVMAVASAAFAPFLAAMFLIGIGHSANQLSRFAVADMYSASAKAAALSWIVWAGTIGAVVGPSLLTAGEVVAGTLAVTASVGTLSLVLVFYCGALLCTAAALPTDPSAISDEDPVAAGAGQSLPFKKLWMLPHVRVASIVMLLGQVAMVLIMTMTPLHISTHGHGLTTVGLIMIAHFVGMFALAPAIGGIVGRVGATRPILAGLCLLALGAVIAAAAPPASEVLLSVALLLVGLGWSFGFVAGSALLTRGLSYAQRVQLQGSVDTIVWSASALASLSSGVLLSMFGFAALCLLGVLLVLAPMVLVAHQRAAMESSLGAAPAH